MKRTSARFHEVSPSEFAWEREGLELLLQGVPGTSPYQVWTNFSFIDNHGQWHEVDALVVGRGRIHLVELKSWEGLFRGNEHQLEVTNRHGHKTRQRNPLKTTRSKAQRLATRLRASIDEIEANGRSIGMAFTEAQLRTPWVQEALFLHGDHVYSEIKSLGAQNVFGRDGESVKTQLPGISERLTEAPGRDPIDEKRSREVLATALEQITGKVQKKRTLSAGSWELTQELEHDEDYVVWGAKNSMHQQRGLAFVSNRSDAPDPVAAKQRDRQLRQSYTLLSSLNHEGIDKPAALEPFSETQAPVLIYPEHEGYEQLDLLLPGLKLTAQQQVDLVLEIADAVSYAHDNGVVHRRLAPSAILLHTSSLKGDNAQVRVKVSRWSTIGEVEADGTLTALPTATSTAYDGHTVFLPPEGFNTSEDRRLNELFSVGTLAYFIFSGGQQPAHDKARLLARLQEHQGLDLGATGATVEDEVRALISSVTAPVPQDRLRQIIPKRGGAGAKQQNPVLLFADALRDRTRSRRGDDGTDPLTPTIGGVVDSRFTVRKVLGTGSTALGLRVADEEAGDKNRVLKVGLRPERTSTLNKEAQALQDLEQSLGKSLTRKHFVSLLEGPLYLPHDRVALLLSDCGPYTLTDTIQLQGPPAESFWDYARQLLDALVALEATGVPHRDIKPANIGLQTAGNKTKLMLFDFSLSREPLENIQAGSPPYHDPFLAAGQQGRAHFDSAAERYSVAAVLLQMAAHTSPVYGDGSANPATLSEQRLELDESELRAFLTDEQRSAMVEFFRSALDGDVDARHTSAEDMRTEFLRIQSLTTADASTAPTVPKKALPDSTPTVPARPQIRSFTAFQEQVIAYSGKKNTISRRYVQHALAQAEREIADPFATASSYAELLDSSTQRVHQLPAELPEKWAASTELLDVLDDLAGAVAGALHAFGGIATPAQLNQAVTSVLHEDLTSQTSREQQGVLRLVELHTNRTGAVLRPVRRGRHHAMVAFTTDEPLAELPKVLEDAAVGLVKATGTEIVTAERLQTTLTQAAARHLEVDPANLPVNASALPELATFRSALVSLTSAGELYAQDIALISMLRDVIRPSSDALTPGMLKQSLLTRFPDAKQKLPKTPHLIGLISQIDPDFRWHPDENKFFRRRENATSGIATKQPDSTIQHGSRPLSEVAPELRDLFASLEATITSHDFRVVPAPLGTTGELVTALQNQFGAVHVDLADAILDELYERMASSGQEDRFDVLLGLDNAASRADLAQVVYDAAETVLTNAGHLDAPAVILTDASILARFGGMELLSRWTDIAAGNNTRAIWLVIPQEGTPDQNISVEGQPLPLTSPSQILSFTPSAAPTPTN